MTQAWRRHIAGLHLAGLVLWALLACSGSVWLASARLQQLHAAFETDARIVHRLLSQRVVQHDAVMSTLALLQPTAVQGALPDAGATSAAAALPDCRPCTRRSCRCCSGRQTAPGLLRCKPR